MLELQYNQHNDFSLALNLFCPLSKKTECFNKDSADQILSTWRNLPLSCFCDWISFGRFIVLLTDRKKSQCGTGCFNEADLSSGYWSKQQ